MLVGVAGCTATFAAAPAPAATILATPTKSPPKYYVLHRAKARCKPHYVKRTVKIRRRRHGKLVKVKQVRCIRIATRAAGAGKATSAPVGLTTGTINVSVLPRVTTHSYGTAAGATLRIDGSGVLANATGSGLGAALVSGPAHGSLTLNRDGSFSYAPQSGASGIERFVYKAVSSTGESSTPAGVTINVTPVAVDDTFSVASNGTLTIPPGGLLAGDLGTGLSVEVVSQPAEGVLTLNPDGSGTYAPYIGFTGSDSFTYQAVDSASQHSNTATVTINVGAQPPALLPQTYMGAIANTEFDVGAAGGDGPAVSIAGSTALDGDYDPNGGALSVSPGTIATAHGGSVTIDAAGDFSYEPPVGFAGPSDSFTYTVDSSEGGSATATATIDFTGSRVWYVNDASAAPGAGTSAAPFTSLGAASAALGQGDVVYLYGGDSAYGGGITLARNVSLIGSGAPLVAGGVTLLDAAGASPVITNAGGAGITLADGDSVSGLTVHGTSGDAIKASGVDSYTLDSDVSVSSAGGDGLDVDGGDGTVGADAQFSGSAGHSVAIQNRTGGTVTVGRDHRHRRRRCGGIDLRATTTPARRSTSPVRSRRAPRRSPRSRRPGAAPSVRPRVRACSRPPPPARSRSRGGP